MKNIVLVLITCFLSFNSNKAYAQWQIISNLYHSFQGAAYAINKDTVFFATINGTIYHTYDGGQTIDSNSFNHLGSWYNDIYFPTKNVGYACGGSAFGQVLSPIVKTTNGGLSWDSLSANQFGFDLHCVFFIDENIGFFGGNGFIIKTTDGGQNFTTDTLSAWDPITDIYFTDSNNGLLFTDSNIYRTTNGGDNWSPFVNTGQNFGFNSSYPRFDFISQNIGYIYVGKNNIYKTTDGGSNWSLWQNINDTLNNYQYIDFVTENIAYATSISNVAGMYYADIKKSTDGGLTWVSQYGDSSRYFFEITMVDENIGYVMGSNALVKTSNAGGVSLTEHKKMKYSLYPNPASHTLNLETRNQNISKISLHSISGQFIAELTISDDKQINLPLHLSEAYYLLLIHSENGETESLTLQVNQP